MIQSLLLVGTGGALGSMLRFIIQKYLNLHLPYGTMIVNVLGCFLVGILMALITKNHLTEQTKLLMITGFCGGFTTFSAFSAESNQLLSANKPLLFYGYIIATITICLSATFIGFKLFK